MHEVPAPSSDAVVTPWSRPVTTERVLELIEHIDLATARIADVGAGTGYLSQFLSDALRARGLDPAEHVFACDLIPESFACDAVTCAAVYEDGQLPFDDEQFDAVISVEVVEHVEDHFAFMRELGRIAKPGGLVIVTTPNTLNINSRVRNLMTGFPVLFDPLPLDEHDPRHLGGHIYPVSPYYLAYAARRAGLENPTFHSDRTKKSAVFLTLLLAPVLLLGGWLFRAHQKRRQPDVLRDNAAMVNAVQGWGILTCRTAVLRAVKPARGV